MVANIKGMEKIMSLCLTVSEGDNINVKYKGIGVGASPRELIV